MYWNPVAVGQSLPTINGELDCPNQDGAALIFANYAKKQLEIKPGLNFVFDKVLRGSAPQLG